MPPELREGEENYISIKFMFHNGEVSQSFCPGRETCIVWFDNEGGFNIEIEDTEKYLKQEISFLQNKLKDYNHYMNQ